jgi:hypothetical protein
MRFRVPSPKEYYRAISGQVLTNISNTGDGVERANLPFVFQWRGQVNYTQVSVNSNGYVFPGNVAGSSFIVVWYQRLNPIVAGNIYVANMDGVFVISWEGVPQWVGLPENGLNFQVALHPGGNVEIRWGDGNPPANAIYGASGIEDDAAGMTVPATRFPFSNEAYSAGVSETFPSNQCRIFIVSTAMGNYTEWPWT